MKHDYAAFLDGYKPMLILEHYKKATSLVETYPQFRYNDDLSFYFHLVEQKAQFVEALSRVERGSYEETYLTGTALGYPRKSVEFFAQNAEIEERTGESPNRKYSLIMIWAGFRFATHMDFVYSEAKWLWDTYKHPKTEGEPLYLWGNGIDIEVKHKDFGALKQVCEYIQEKREVVTAV